MRKNQQTSRSGVGESETQTIDKEGRIERKERKKSDQDLGLDNDGSVYAYTYSLLLTHVQACFALFRDGYSLTARGVTKKVALGDQMYWLKTADDSIRKSYV